MNGLEVSKETFEKAPEETKLSILYDIAVASYHEVGALKIGMEALKKRKRFDTAVSGVGGTIGGIIAVIGSRLFWKP